VSALSTSTREESRLTRAEFQRRVLLLLLCVAAVTGVVAGAAGSASAAIPIGLAVAAPLVIAILMRPQLGLPIAVFVLWSDAAGVTSFYHGAPTAIAGIIPVLLCAPLIAGLLRGERMVLDEGFIWMLLVLLAEIVTTLTSAYADVGLGRVEKTIQEGLLIYLLIINVVRTPGALRTAAWSIIAAGAFLSLFTLAQELGHRYDHSFFGFAQLDHQYLVGKDDSFRAQGPLADPNYYAQILIVSFSLAVVFMFREVTRRIRWIAGICAAMMLVATVFTYSRGGALAVAVLIVLLAAFRYLRPRHLAAIALVIVGLLVAFPKYGNRLSSLSQVSGATAQVGSSSAADLSIQQRATEQAAALLAIRDHPIFGIGPGGFPLVYQTYADKAGGAIHQASQHAQDGTAAGEAPQRAVPNIFESVAADQGVIGVVPFVCFLVSVALGLIRARRRWVRRNPQLEALATGYLVALIGYVVSGAFLALAFERYIWALLALGGAAGLVLSRCADPDRAAAADLDVPLVPDGRESVPAAVGAYIPGSWDEISHAGEQR
jgi:O-antigen ligase